MFKIIQESHLDHGLTEAHRAWIESTFHGRDAFFIETILIPYWLPSVPCGLHGPAMSDTPVLADEVRMEIRGSRKGLSRIFARAPRQSRQLTVIAGPFGAEPCVLFTAYGGPAAPKEPWDAAPHELERSQRFWAEHALSRES